MNDGTHTKAGTLGGTAVTLLANINSNDVIKTMVMAGIGAAVSFVVSHVLKKIFARLKRPPKSPVP